MTACSSGGLGFNPNTEFAGPIGPLPDGGGPDFSIYAVSLAETTPGGITCEETLPGSGVTFQIHRDLIMLVGTSDGVQLKPRVYDVIPLLAPPDAGDPVAVLLLEDSDGGTIAVGESGTVTLTQVTAGVPGSLAGSYSSTLVDVDGGTLTMSGSFAASTCQLFEY
jgi:hypothetical protein